MKRTLVLVLGGGRGTRLYPLTQYRSKPAVPLAGKYRLIDIPLSNCINSGLNRIYVLTQFHSVSLHRHIRQTYNFDTFAGGFVEILAAQQTLEGSDWYQGTADAVRQNLRYIQQPDVDRVLILSGDQLYRMDFAKMSRTHLDAGADATIATLPVRGEDARSLGVMRADTQGRVTGFVEKPQTDEELATVRSDREWIAAHGIADDGRDCLASMGIYLFNRDVLVDALTRNDHQDFGKEVFPALIDSHRVQVHLFDGYWEDIGTIRSFYDANLQLAAADPPFSMTSPNLPIYSRMRFLAPSRIQGIQVRQSLLADGCLIDEDVTIENSVVGLRCRIGRGVTIRNSIIMGADFYQSPAEIKTDREQGVPLIGIADGTTIDGAIVDKNVRIGKNVSIANREGIDHADVGDDIVIRDGIVCVGKAATVADDRSI